MYLKSYDQKVLFENTGDFNMRKKTIKVVFIINELKKKNFMHFMHLKYLMNTVELKKNLTELK